MTEPLPELVAELPGGRRLTGARAAGAALEALGGGWRLWGLACRLPGAGLAYRLVAADRARLSRWWSDEP